jgi:hypothetical protein
VYKGDDEQIYDASYSPWNTQGKLFENPKVDVVTPSREPVRS